MQTILKGGKPMMDQAKHRLRRRVLTAAAGVGAGAVAVTCGMAHALSGLAVNRKFPAYGKLLNVSGGKKDKNFRARRDAAAQSLAQMPSETVTIRSFDGLELVGHLVRCENPRRLIIAFHGWRSGWARDFCLVAPFWHSHNCDVLYVEQRAQGNSQGDYIGFGLLERKDCLSWAQWADSQDFGLPIYLSGISMGATTVLMAAGEPLPESVKGIQADCGFTSPKAIWKHVTEQNLHMSVGPLRQVCTDLAFRRKLRQGLSAYSTRTAMEQNTIPVLFVHGTEDRFVPIQMTYDNYLSCAAPRYLVVVPGATHAMSYAVEPETCQRAMLSFWQTYDGNGTEAPS